MNLKNTMFILVIVVFLLQMIVLKQDANLASKENQKSKKQTIALSTFPLYDIAKNIVKQRMDTYMILPVGVDIHSYEPTPKEIVRLHKSSLVIYNGASLDPWISRLNFKNKTLNMSEFVDLLQLDKIHEHDHHADESSKEKVDPHYWLSIENMKKATIKITEQIIKLDMANKDFYLKNQEKYLRELQSIDASYKESLKECKKKEILTSHNAFSYLANQYNFEVLSLSSISPDTQVDAKSMIDLIKHLKEHSISTVFYESFTSALAMQTLANEAGVKVEVLQPLANITKDEIGLSYKELMLKNLAKLAEAMECK